MTCNTNSHDTAWGNANGRVINIGNLYDMLQTRYAQLKTTFQLKKTFQLKSTDQADMAIVRIVKIHEQGKMNFLSELDLFY